MNLAQANATLAKFRIVPKRDFGNQAHLINGRMVSRGFVVINANGKWKGCNAMPGATWSQDIAGALQLIKVLRHVGTDEDGQLLPGTSDRFWAIVHRINGATARSRAQARHVRAMVAARWS